MFFYRDTQTENKPKETFRAGKLNNLFCNGIALGRDIFVQIIIILSEGSDWMWTLGS